MKFSAILSLVISSLVVSCLNAACDGDSGSGDEGAGGGAGGPALPPQDAAPDSWEGATVHLRAVGRIQGEDINFTFRGESAEDVERVFCERNYIVPDLEDTAAWKDEGYLEKIEVKWLTVLDGTEREYQIELLAHDFSASEDGDRLTVLPLDEESTELSNDSLMTTFSWEYEEDGNEVEVDAPSEAGSLVRGELSGKLGPDGLTIPDGEGTLGGYLHLDWENGDVLDVSFTVNCGENDLDIPE